MSPNALDSEARGHPQPFHKAGLSVNREKESFTLQKELVASVK